MVVSAGAAAGSHHHPEIPPIERGKVSGEFRADTDAELLVDQIFGPIYYRMLLRITPLDQAFGDKLVDQVLRGVRGPVSRC